MTYCLLCNKNNISSIVDWVEKDRLNYKNVTNITHYDLLPIV